MSQLLKQLVMCFALFSSTSVFAWRESSGGDGVVSDFKMVARQLIQEMSLIHENTKISEKLERSLNTVNFESKDSVELNNVVKDAVNQTGKKPYSITINRSKWLQYNDSKKLKELLVLHELLFTIKIDDSDYATSHRIYKAILNSRNTLALNIENKI